MEPRVAIVSDTIDNVDGVAIGLRRLVAAGRRAGHAMTLIGPGLGSDEGVVRIPAAMSAALPMYPQYTWSVPQLPALTSWLAKHADIVQLATPGPMGMAGLIAAQMLGLPVIAQYHTEVPDYAARMTGLPFMKDLVTPFVAWFYQQAELCLAPSRAVEDRLRGFGVTAIRRIRRGTDLALFDPAKRARTDTAPTALYVGRVSKEKNIDVLRAAWIEIRAARPDATLQIVGDGPLAIDGPGIHRIGVLHGEPLARAFANADVFLFPSETETFGNVVVEAAASGVPVIVSSKGAAHEHVTEHTGVIADDPTSIAREALGLFADPDRRREMSLAARAHARTYDLDQALVETWAIYNELPARMKAAS